MEQQTKTERVNFRISPADKQKLAELAAKENRTITNYIETLIKRAIEDAQN